MSDLRELLGDKYDTMHALARDAYWGRGHTETASLRIAVDAALAAVLPDLLAVAWDEGRKLGIRQADWEYGVTPDPMPDLANPYRTEEHR